MNSLNLISLMLLSGSILGSATPTFGGLVTAGYTPLPNSVKVAPGQVITFLVQGIGNDLSGRVRTVSAPWPKTLAGISVNFVWDSVSISVPLLSVEPIEMCQSQVPGCGKYSAVTLQIPFEIPAVAPGLNCLSCVAMDSRLQFLENGVLRSTIFVGSWVDQIHLLKCTDLIFSGIECRGTVTHLDGTPVTMDSPAEAGEHIVLYAVGLGYLDSRVEDGAAFPTGKTGERFGVGFDARPNALAARPLAISQANGNMVPAVEPDFVGPVAGFVGLYQINVVVPHLPSGLPACRVVGDRVAISTLSNLTLTIYGPASFDGVGICVKPPA